MITGHVRHSLLLTGLADPQVARRALDALAVRLGRVLARPVPQTSALASDYHGRDAPPGARR